jgi:hypothetical protein
MKDAIRRYLEEEEAAEKARVEALERWASFEKTGEYVDGDDVTEWLKSWGTAKERPCPKPRRPRLPLKSPPRPRQKPSGRFLGLGGGEG